MRGYNAGNVLSLGVLWVTSRNGVGHWRSDLKHLSLQPPLACVPLAVYEKLSLGLVDSVLDPEAESEIPALSNTHSQQSSECSFLFIVPKMVAIAQNVFEGSYINSGLSRKCLYIVCLGHCIFRKTQVFSVASCGR